MKPKATPFAVPGWDRSRPADSFKTFARQIHVTAKEVLIRDGSHAEMFLFLPLDGRGHAVLWNNNDRDAEAGWLRKHIAKHYAYGVIHIVEAWMRMALSPDDPTFRRIMSGETKVSELPPAERREILMVSALSRDGWAVSWSDEILRVGCKPFFGICHEVGDFRGRFGKLFG